MSANRGTARLPMGGRRCRPGCRAAPICPDFTALLLLQLLPQMLGILSPVESSAVPASREIIALRTLETLRNSSSRDRRSAVTAAASPQALRAVRESIIVVAHPGLVQGFTLPADTFSEPLDKLHISVTLWNGSALPRDHWLSFWKTDHQIVVHAGPSEVGTHDFLLRAVPRTHKGYGTKTVAAALACLRAIVEELLDQWSRNTSTGRTTTCRPPPAEAKLQPRATVSSLVVNAVRGKELRYKLPDHLFSDPEDGVRRHLEAQLFSVDSESRSPIIAHVSPSSPLQLVSAPAASRYLSGLYWQSVNRSTALRFLLRATDRDDAYADVSVQLNITEPPTPAFVFRAQLSVDWSLFSNDVMRQLDFLSRVAHVAGDSGTVNVSLLDVRQSLQSSTDLRQTSNVLVTWTHTGLALAAVASACPEEAIQSLARRFMVHDVITAAAADKECGLGSFGVISIELEPRERCLNKMANEVAVAPVVTQLVEYYAVGALVLAVAFVLIVLRYRRRHANGYQVSCSHNDSLMAHAKEGLRWLMSKRFPSPPDHVHQRGRGSSCGSAYREQKQPLKSPQHGADGGPCPAADAKPTNYPQPTACGLPKFL